MIYFFRGFVFDDFIFIAAYNVVGLLLDLKTVILHSSGNILPQPLSYSEILRKYFDLDKNYTKNK